MKDNIKTAMSAKLDDNLNFQTQTDNLVQTSSLYNSGDFAEATQTMYKSWDWWQDRYYPQVIRESYPIYIQERAQDKGKQAFEIIKMLKDKKLIKLETVGDFIEAMDALIKIL